MKRLKLIGCLVALFAVVLNSVLATTGNRSLSASELDVENVELMAEGEPDIGPIGIAVAESLIQLGEGLLVYYLTQGGGEWVDHDVYEKGRLVETTRECVRCSIFCSDNCKSGESVTHKF